MFFIFIQKGVIGREIDRRKRIVLCKERPRRVCFLAPKAGPQMDSIPMVRSESMENWGFAKLDGLLLESVRSGFLLSWVLVCWEFGDE